MSACSFLDTYAMYTPTWQFSFLPSRPHHCRCTPTEAVPFLAKARRVKHDHAVGLSQVAHRPAGRASGARTGSSRAQGRGTSGGLAVPGHGGRQFPSPVLCSRFETRPVRYSVACRRCSGSLSVAANGSMKTSNRSSRPSNKSGDTCDCASMSANRALYHLSITPRFL